MKYSVSNEVLTVESLAGDMQLVSHYIAGLPRLLARLIKRAFVGCYAYMLKGVVAIVNYAVSGEFLENAQVRQRRVYEQKYHRKIPQHMWQRHSALLFELESLRDFRPVDGMETEQGVVTSKVSNSLHINVVGIRNIPVWSSNLEDIGVITR